MLRQSKRSGAISPTISPTNAVCPPNDYGKYCEPPRRREGFWNRPLNAVAIFAGTFAFAASLTMGVMHANADGGTAGVQNAVWSRMLLGRSPKNVLDTAILLVETKGKAQDVVPLLVMGLPRSGSNAIHDFFTCNTIKSAHYCCDTDHSAPDGQISRSKFPCRKDQVTCGSCVLQNMKTERPPFEGCGDYYVWSQFDVETTEPFAWFIPQNKALPLLSEAYPNAAFILNTRETAGVWADSVLHWHSITTRIFNSFDLKVIDSMDDYTPDEDKVSYESLMHDAQVSLDAASDPNELKRKRELLIQVYERHNNKIRAWAERYNHPLMEINVDYPGAGEDLGKAFKMSDECWNFDADEVDNDWKNFSFPF
jgi:Sulfotransferase domain